MMEGGLVVVVVVVLCVCRCCGMSFCPAVVGHKVTGRFGVVLFTMAG